MLSSFFQIDDLPVFENFTPFTEVKEVTPEEFIRLKTNDKVKVVYSKFIPPKLTDLHFGKFIVEIDTNVGEQ